MVKKLIFFIAMILLYLIILGMGISVFYYIFGMGLDDRATLSNIFVWSATLFAPVSAFVIFNGWKTQHNMGVKKNIAENCSLKLNKCKESLDQIYYLIYVNKPTRGKFFPINLDPIDSILSEKIIEFNELSITDFNEVIKDLKRLSRSNNSLKMTLENFEEKFNTYHSRMFFFIDAKFRGEFPEVGDLDLNESFKEIFDFYHEFSQVCEKMDSDLDKYIFV